MLWEPEQHSSRQLFIQSFQVSFFYFCFYHSLYNVYGNYCSAKKAATVAEVTHFPGPWAQGPTCVKDPSGVQGIHSNPMLCAVYYTTLSPVHDP